MHLKGDEARRMRNEHGWTLQQLANRSGINKAYLSEFENGDRTLSDESLQKLAATLEEAADRDCDHVYTPSQWEKIEEGKWMVMKVICSRCLMEADIP